MLDVARHFFGVEDVKHYIELLAMYKLNVLHLHLADDQGWRIEIKSWPQLALVGGSTAVYGEGGGYYTQAQYTELVAYAAERFITIVPEIDLPGHTSAALASYAELNCDGEPQPLYTGTNVGFSSLCIDKEITYEFLDDVLRELAEMTPGPYIHIGGDEAMATPADAYLRFMQRVQPIVQKYGKQVVGWEELGQAPLQPGTLVQQWNTDPSRTVHTLQAVEQGAKVIVSPASRTYLDMKYTAGTALGLQWAGLAEVRDAYDWEPTCYMDGVGEAQVAGVEAPLWSETLRTLDEIEYMVLPRLSGIAEIGWSPRDGRSWEEYRTRLAAQAAYWQALELNFYRSPQVTWP
jgi:hexosaminidase